MNARSVLVLSIMIGLAIRLSFRDFQSGDFQWHLNPWYKFIIEHGGFAALKHKFSNYNVPYLYLLSLASYVGNGLPSLYVIKTISVGFDLLLAAYAYRLVALKYPSGPTAAFAFAAVFLSPTVFVNSALWGQSDVIYTTGLLACIYYLCTGHKKLACLAFGFAVSFKLQAMFLSPLLFILLIRSEISVKNLLLIPAVFLLVLIPAWLIGRPLDELVLIYFEQAQTYERLTLNAPNLYQWISNEHYNLMVPMGFAATTILVLILSAFMYRYPHKLSSGMIISISTVVLVLVPYFLPKMHERYFYSADVISIIFALYFPRFWFVPIIVISCSFLSYTPYLFELTIIPLPLLSVFVLVSLVILVLHMRHLMKPKYAHA